MHKLLAVLVICTFLSAGCAPTPGYPDLYVKRRYAPGFSTYLRSQVEIDGNGKVTSESYSQTFDRGGRLTGVVTTTQIGRITPQHVEELAAALKRPDVWAMEDHLSFTGYTDAPWTYLTIRLNGQSKSISYWGGDEPCGPRRTFYGPRVSLPPMAFCRLDNTIRAIVNATRWVYVKTVVRTPPPKP